MPAGSTAKGIAAGLAAAALCCLPFAAALGQSPPSAEDFVRSYAARYGAPGTPAHTAALREALGLAADELERPAPKGTKRFAPRPPAPPPPVLTIDSDPRYRAWLTQAAGRPPVSESEAEGEPRIKVRAVGSVLLPEASHYPDVAIVFEPRTAGAGGRDRGFCSGALIDRRTVLTAGHCLCGSAVVSVAFGPSLDGSITRIAVTGQARHEGIRCRPGGGADWRSLRGRDIAVLRLAEEVPADIVPKIREYANPALVAREFARGNRVLEVLGFGQNDAGADSFKNLARIPILSPDCSGSPGDGRTDEQAYGCQRGREILAKDWRRVGPCFGDSGGGAYLLVKTDPAPSSRPERFLAGLVSRTILGAAFDCGDGEIFTLLTPDLRAWVRRARARLADRGAVP